MFLGWQNQAIIRTTIHHSGNMRLQVLFKTKKASQKWLMTNNVENRIQYVRINNEAKRAFSKAKNKQWENKCEETVTCINSTKSRADWKVITKFLN